MPVWLIVTSSCVGYILVGGTAAMAMWNSDQKSDKPSPADAGWPFCVIIFWPIIAAVAAFWIPCSIIGDVICPPKSSGTIEG